MKIDQEPSAIQSEPLPAPARASLDWVHIAKGIGITLVVIGHFKPPDESPPWWAEIHHCLYTFHMPLFFILSGFLYSHGKYPYGQLVASKFRRLMVPFFSIGLCFFVIKYLAGLAFDLRQPVNAETVMLFLTNPVRSFAPLLWFVYALFLIFVFYPPLRALLRSNTAVMLAAIAVMHGVIWSLRWCEPGWENILVYDIPSLGRVDTNWLGTPLDNMFLFTFGVMLRENRSIARAAMGPGIGRIVITAALFAGVYAWARLTLPTYPDGINWLEYQWLWLPRQLGGALGAVMVINISMALAAAGASRRLRRAAFAVGFYSMTIYLFHPIFESGVRIGFLQALARSPLHFDMQRFLVDGPVLPRQLVFLAIALTAITAGLLGPLALEKYALRKMALTRKCLLGMD